MTSCTHQSLPRQATYAAYSSPKPNDQRPKGFLGWRGALSHWQKLHHWPQHAANNSPSFVPSVPPTSESPSSPKQRRQVVVVVVVVLHTAYLPYLSTYYRQLHIAPPHFTIYLPLLFFFFFFDDSLYIVPPLFTSHSSTTISVCDTSEPFLPL